MNYLEARTTDLDEIVHIHLDRFGGFFLTSLGGKFLRLFYLSFIEEKEGVCLVGKNNSQVVGFVVGAINPQLFYKKLILKRAIPLFLSALPVLVKSPLNHMKYIVNILKGKGDQPPKINRSALVSSIAIGAQFQRMSVGKNLINYFCEHVNSRGIDSVYLLTDAENNEKVNMFYVNNGFYLESVILRRSGRSMNRYMRIC